jgi:hypothetical protein
LTDESCQTELPRTFADYLLLKFGGDNVDVEHLREAFKRGISLLPPETRKAAIAAKKKYEWGKLV